MINAEEGNGIVVSFFIMFISINYMSKELSQVTFRFRESNSDPEE